MITEQALVIPEDYREWLQLLHIPFQEKGIYIQVGDIPVATGWMLEVGVIALQLDKFIAKVVPFLIGEKIPFLLPLEREAAFVLIGSGAGYAQTGRVLVVFPSTEQQVAVLEQKLVALTEEFRAPAIPGTYWLGGAVFARFGAFKVMPAAADADATLPKGVNWPFLASRQPALAQTKKILHNAYRITELIKHNPKGDAMKAVYYKSLFNMGKCFIKQGRINTFMDVVGRDSRDRLKWQYQLHQELKDMRGLPRVLDLFEEDRDCYLVTELIKGQSFTQLVHESMLYTTWLGVPLSGQKKILTVLQQIIRLVQQLHSRGYLHRDVAPENFLIVKNDVYMIDLELAWNWKNRQPMPAFVLGSPGYMSPSQQNQLLPVVEDDIYAIGALLAFTFCCYQPARLNTNLADMKNRLVFMTGSANMAALIVTCLDPVGEHRPVLEQVEAGLAEYVRLLTSAGAPRKDTGYLSPSDLKQYAQKCVNAVNNGLMCDENGVWWSLSRQNRERHEMNVQRIRAVYPAIVYGMAGAMWVMSMAKKAGMVVDSDRCYQVNLNVLRKEFIYSDKTALGLYDGLAGVAIALAAGMRQGLIPDSKTAREELLHCLKQPVAGVSIANGAAGHGLAVLCCLPYLDEVIVKDMLEQDIQNILKYLHRKGEKMEAGFFHGLAGVLYFLWTYLHFYEHAEVRKNAVSGMDYLRKLIWKNKQMALEMEGGAGWIRAYLRAFEVSGTPEYRNVAEALLGRIPTSITSNFHEYVQGIWGIGDTLVEAVKLLGRESDKKRVGNLVSRATHMLYNDNEENAYWLLRSEDTPVTGGISDNTGGLFLLLRVIFPEQISSWFDPF